MKQPSSPLGNTPLNLTNKHRAINLRDWRPGNGLAILRPGSPCVQTSQPSAPATPAARPASLAASVRREVKASVRTLQLRPIEAPIASTTLLPAPSAHERVAMEFSSLEGGISCVRLHGLSPSPLELERVGQEVRGMLTVSGAHLVVDVADVGSFHCALINWLLDLQAACARQGGQMILTGLSSAAHDMLLSTGLSRKLHFADTVPEAHASLLAFRRRAAA